jgi:hypothetical protein
MKLKVISGGQTGADLAGLWVARHLGLETGGMAPKGWETLAGPKPSLGSIFGLTESTGGYRQRTVENVKAADKTLVFSRNMRSPGTVLTINSCKKLGRHDDVFLFPDVRDRALDSLEAYWRVAAPVSQGFNDAYSGIWTQLILIGECTVNVAGNATKNSADAFEYTFMGLWKLFEKIARTSIIGSERVEGLEPAKFDFDSPYAVAMLANRYKDRYEA